MAEAELKARVKTLIGVVLVGAVLLLSYEIFYWFTHVYESDVRVQTDFTDISSRVDGKIAEFAYDGVSTGLQLVSQVDGFLWRVNEILLPCLIELVAEAFECEDSGGGPGQQ